MPRLKEEQSKKEQGFWGKITSELGQIVLALQVLTNEVGKNSLKSDGTVTTNHNTAQTAKDSAGAVKTIYKLDTNNDIQVGEDNVAGHTTINAGTNKLVKVKVLRQDISSNGYHKNSVIFTGWGYWTGDGTSKRKINTITFATAFSAAPIVIIGGLGYLGSNPAAIGGLTAIAASIGDVSFTYAATDIATTGFNAELTNYDVALTATWRLGFSWIAIGQIS